MNKKDAILISDLLPGQESIIEAFLRSSSALVISRSKLSDNFQFKNRLLILEDLVDSATLSEVAKSEANARLTSTHAILERKLRELPQGNLLGVDEMESIRKTVQHDLQQMLFCTSALEEICKTYNVLSFICNWSFLSANQAMIAFCRKRNIRSLHLEHGTWSVPQSERPEAADYIALASNFAFDIFNDGPSKNARPVVTGLPLNGNKSLITDSTQLAAAQAAAREQLGLPKDSKVILYASTWCEGMYLSASCYWFNLVNAFEAFLGAVKELQREGENVYVLLRQHPSVIPFESELGYLTMVENLGVQNVQMINSQKEECLCASDVVVVPKTETTFVLDAFGAGKPLLSLNAFPLHCAFHPLAERIISPLIETARDQDGIYAKLNLLLSDSKVREEKVAKALEFTRANTQFNAQEAVENLAELIHQLSGTKQLSAGDPSAPFC